MTSAVPRAGLLGALALATETADELVLGTVRDVHSAVAGRVYGLTNRATGGSAVLPEQVHGRIATAVYDGLGAGLRATSRALRAADRKGIGARLESTPHGRFTLAAVNGLIGDRLAADGSEMAIELAVRAHGSDVPLDPEHLAEAFPAAGGDVVVFLHGLSEGEHSWHRGGAAAGGPYGKRLQADLGWTPVYLRANTGLPVAENGAALAGLLDDLVGAWPVPVRRIALVGHSMGGLIMRAACAVVTEADSPWNSLVTDVVTLGTPHLGAPMERGVHLGAQALGLLPESAPLGRILEYRSVGILDLRSGLAADVQNLPNARYHLVGATLAASPTHPVSAALGDLLVRYPSAIGRPRRGRELFPDADTLHIRGGHFDLLNHHEVYDALRAWLA
ncbi:MAG: esterase/lipase family protein [Nocardioidaceae bacterium]